MIKKMWQSWCHFWFEKKGLKQLALFRMILCSVGAVTYGLRLLQLDQFYSSQGLLTSERAQELWQQGFEPWVSLVTTSDSLTYAVAFFHVFGLLLLALGVVGRNFTWLVYLLHLALMQRNFSLVYGGDTIMCFMLFYLSFCQHNLYYSIIPRKKVAADLFSSLGYRFIQVQVAVIYAYTGLEKMRGEQWWEGSAIWSVMGNMQTVPFDLTFFSKAPWLIGLMTWATLLFEIYFPFAVLRRSTRYVWLSVGVFLHGGAAIFMGLPSFSLFMLSTYLLFLTPKEFKTLTSFKTSSSS